MKRTIAIALLAFLLGGAFLAAASTDDQRRPRPRRTVVVVHKGFPLHRPLRAVVVRPLRHPFLVAPRLFLPVVFWSAVVVASLPAGSAFVWEDAETLSSEEEWTEVGLNCQNTGSKLWLQVVAGEARFDWAEVTFGNGEAQVVDMKEYLRGPGYYQLLDFANGRQVDHVRLLAKAETPEARIALKMQK